MGRRPIQQCFISYAWESEEHKTWVRHLADRLQRNGVSTFLDQWDVLAGMDVVQYMETRIRECEFVLLICTPIFAKKADANKGGVGYEKAIVTGEIFQGTASGIKYVPLLRLGEASRSLPSYLKSRAFIDFRDTADFSESFESLLRHIFRSPKFVRPARGAPPSLRPKAAGRLRGAHPKSARLARLGRLHPEGYLTTSRSSFSGRRSAVVPTSNRRRTLSVAIENDFDRNVFLNCPFDLAYRPLWNALVFTVIASGFRPRSALELTHGSANRFQRIFTLVSECKFGIHDLSRSQAARLPRMNIPFELGIFMGAQRFEHAQKRDRFSLILDDDPYRHQQTLSDISGYDVGNHGGNSKKLVETVGDWLRAASRITSLPSGSALWDSYTKFKASLPARRWASLRVKEFNFHDDVALVEGWLLDRASK